MVSAITRKRFSLSRRPASAFRFRARCHNNAMMSRNCTPISANTGMKYFRSRSHSVGGRYKTTAARRQRRLRNMPSLKLAPVHANLKTGVVHNGNVVRPHRRKGPLPPLPRPGQVLWWRRSTLRQCHHGPKRALGRWNRSGSAVRLQLEHRKLQSLADLILAGQAEIESPYEEGV